MIGLARELEGEEKTGKVVAVRLASPRASGGARPRGLCGRTWTQQASVSAHVRRQYGRESIYLELIS